MIDKAVAKNTELPLMGSHVLVMLMKGEDVYVMNVKNIRAILAKKQNPDWVKSLLKLKHWENIDPAGTWNNSVRKRHMIWRPLMIS